MEDEKFCQFCGEPLEDGDVCYSCHEYDVEQAYRKGYEEGFRRGFEEGRDEGRDSVISRRIRERC
jgi:hypothetical protein